MKQLLVAIVILGSGLWACSGSGPQPPAKLEGAPVGSLTQAQVDDIDTQCFVKYGSVDDSRVPYTQSYCHLVEVERNRRAMTVPKAEQQKNSSLLMLGKDKAQPTGKQNP
jgi:hypothetical protein